MITITWTYIGGYYSERGECCDNCGHPIKHIHQIKASTGAVRKLGSDCILTLVDPSAKIEMAKIEKRLKVAAAQWRKKTPSPRTNETREEYIQRRVTEMANAWTGYKTFLATPRNAWSYNGWTARHQRVLNRLFRLNGVVAPDAKNYSVHSVFADTRRKIEHEICERQNKRVHARIERMTGANRFDYQRASWEVKKI